jgi:hypothetical protein
MDPNQHRDLQLLLWTLKLTLDSIVTATRIPVTTDHCAPCSYALHSRFRDGLHPYNWGQAFIYTCLARFWETGGALFMG